MPRKREPNGNFGKLLEHNLGWLNLLPGGVELKILRDWLESERERFEFAISECSDPEGRFGLERQSIETLRSEIGPELADFLQIDYLESDATQCFEHIEWALDNKQLLIDLIGLVSDKNGRSNDERASLEVFNLPTVIILNPDSTLTISQSSIAQVLEMHKIPINRIRICQYRKCSKIFFAKNLKSITCSSSCRNRFDQQKHRTNKLRALLEVKLAARKKCCRLSLNNSIVVKLDREIERLTEKLDQEPDRDGTL